MLRGAFDVGPKLCAWDHSQLLCRNQVCPGMRLGHRKCLPQAPEFPAWASGGVGDHVRGVGVEWGDTESSQQWVGFAHAGACRQVELGHG